MAFKVKVNGNTHSVDVDGDTPLLWVLRVVARGAAIGVGIAAVAVVNDLLAAPDSHPQLAATLAAIHRRVRDYAKSIIRDEATDPATAAGLLRDIAALRSEMTGLATESLDGSVRSAGARSTAVALVAELHAARALNALPLAAEPALRELIISALDRAVNTRQSPPPYGTTTLNATHPTPSRHHWSGPLENCCDETGKYRKDSSP
jgi:Fusaric acid resistance protein family